MQDNIWKIVWAVLMITLLIGGIIVGWLEGHNYNWKNKKERQDDH